MIFNIKEYPKYTLKTLIERGLAFPEYKEYIKMQTKFYCDFETGLGYNLKLGLQIDIRQITPY